MRSEFCIGQTRAQHTFAENGIFAVEKFSKRAKHGKMGSHLLYLALVIMFSFFLSEYKCFTYSMEQLSFDVNCDSHFEIALREAISTWVRVRVNGGCLLSIACARAAIRCHKDSVPYRPLFFLPPKINFFVGVAHAISYGYEFAPKTHSHTRTPIGRGIQLQRRGIRYFAFFILCQTRMNAKCATERLTQHWRWVERCGGGGGGSDWWVLGHIPIPSLW